jgi:hypothetical protein
MLGNLNDRLLSAKIFLYIEKEHSMSIKLIGTNLKYGRSQLLISAGYRLILSI